MEEWIVSRIVSSVVAFVDGSTCCCLIIIFACTDSVPKTLRLALHVTQKECCFRVAAHIVRDETHEKEYVRWTGRLTFRLIFVPYVISALYN